MTRIGSAVATAFVLLGVWPIQPPALAQLAGDLQARVNLEDDAASSAGDTREFRVLATTRTSTMERELNDAARAGFRFAAVMGGETAFGGSETVVVMSRRAGAAERFTYQLLATSRTSKMQAELNAAARDGFRYRGQTVFETLFGGEEVVVLLERNDGTQVAPVEYLLVATSRTSTLEQELLEAGRDGYDLLALTVADTAFGGHELMAILQREAGSRR